MQRPGKVNLPLLRIASQNPAQLNCEFSPRTVLIGVILHRIRCHTVRVILFLVVTRRNSEDEGHVGAIFVLCIDLPFRPLF